jgi:hypothetical protein
MLMAIMTYGRRVIMAWDSRVPGRTPGKEQPYRQKHEKATRVDARRA